MTLPTTIAEAEAAVANVPTSRTCQGCDLCCTAVGVEEIGKRPGDPCPHLKGLPGFSCSIYRERPVSCASFVCLWRASDLALPPEAFPARAGFVVAIPRVEPLPLVICVHPDPKRPDAWRAWEATFKALSTYCNAIVVVGQGKLAEKLYAPSGNTFTKADRPDLFKNGGDIVALPSAEFGPDLSLAETVRRIYRWGTTALPSKSGLRSRLLR